MFNKKDFDLRIQIYGIVKDNNLNNLKCFKVNSFNNLNSLE